MSVQETLPLCGEAEGGEEPPVWLSLSPRALPQPFPYQGSKRALVRELLSLFPSDTATLWEPFAGSAAVSVAAKKFGTAERVVLSDVNAPLMRLWDAIVRDPLGLASEYESHWNAQLTDPRSYYLKVRADFNDSGDPALLLYLLCRCVKAAVRYNKRTGEFNQGADHRRLGAKPAALTSRLVRASELMQGSQVEIGDYESRLTQAGGLDLVYLDPPYQGTSDVPDHRYLRGLSRDTFTSALETANTHGVSYLLSYDAHTEDNTYGEPLPDSLDLLHLNVRVGTSSQGTLSGRKIVSYESIYVSPAAVERLGGRHTILRRLRMLGQTELVR